MTETKVVYTTGAPPPNVTTTAAEHARQVRQAWFEVLACMDDMRATAQRTDEVPTCAQKDLLRADLNALHVAWVTFAQLETCPDPARVGMLAESSDGPDVGVNR